MGKLIVATRRNNDMDEVRQNIKHIFFLPHASAKPPMVVPAMAPDTNPVINRYAISSIVYPYDW
jgi:hypothetical protein